MLGPRPPLQHQISTKLLISRFESLADTRPVTSPGISPAKAPLCPPKEPKESKKDKSPIRQSFRNLLAVLKKGSGLRVGKSKLEGVKSIQSQERPPDPTLSPDDPFTVSSQSFPVPVLVGSLFYLARSPATPPTPPSVHPVWTVCSAFLKDDTIDLAWPATPTTHSIFLTRCTDVRSLTSSQLDPEERALLPGDVPDLKVFEILFDGGGGEKFATNSVRERARWVSAIWDVILPSADLGLHRPAGVEFPDSISDPPMSVKPSTICSRTLDRALPPVPDQLDSPIAPARSHSPRNLVYPPTRPESRASTICSRSKSPSIANLSQLSVVKQRLAPIERTQTPRSAPTSPAPLSRNSSVVRTRSLRVQIPSVHVATSRTSPTSILESYGEPCSAVSRAVSPTIDNVQDEHAMSSHRSLSTDVQKVSCLHDPSSDTHVSLDLLTDIHHMVSGVAQRNEDTKDTLKIIQNEIGRPTEPNAVLMQLLGDIDARLCSDLPKIRKLLAEVHAHRSNMFESKEIISKGGEKLAIEAPASCDPVKLDQVLDLLKEDSLQRSMQAHQQMDSVRYLNELNSWLEAFVSGGTAQMQVVAAGVERLCTELGCSGDKKISGDKDLITAIRQSVIDGQARDQSAAALQSSVNNLTALIASESRNGYTAQTIASLIDQQRQDQEGLLRALTAELSTEIRGERLRFVDAMKEATAINVEMHVEQLKAELAREVRADLFAFYSKQKQQAPPPRPMYAAQSRMSPAPRVLPNPTYGVYP